MSGSADSPVRPATRWREQLAAWAIPDEILAAAPTSPWGFSVAGFADRAARQQRDPNPGHDLARQALPPDGGSVLDVGCGGGAASLPLVPPARRVTGVDESADMLVAFRGALEAAGASVRTVEGTWPADAHQLAAVSHDVVVAQDVLYNVPDADDFVRECDRVAARRVVLVLPTVHPMTWTTPYWQRLHGLQRPDGPGLDDALAVIRDRGIDARHTSWREPTLWAVADLDEVVAVVRRRLCLAADRDDEVRAAVTEVPAPVEREAVAVWWDTT